MTATSAITYRGYQITPVDGPAVACVCCGTMHDGEMNGPCETCERQGCDALTIRH